MSAARPGGNGKRTHSGDTNPICASLLAAARAACSRGHFDVSQLLIRQARAWHRGTVL